MRESAKLMKENGISDELIIKCTGINPKDIK